ncbi:MAG: hypothetical protein QW241_09135 [Candidatus Bathyarchaeia archaeon]
MIDDYIINYIINEAKEAVNSQNFVLQKRQCNLYLSADRVERLRRLLGEKMPGVSLSQFIDMLIDAALRALENSPRESRQVEAKTPEAPKCFIVSCENIAVAFAVNKTGRRYPVCERHLEDIKDHPDWFVE